MTRSRVALVVVALVGLVGLLVHQSTQTAGHEPDAKRFPIRGVDVSHHQGAIDWSKVAASGVTFAYIKATEGRDFTDARFAENRRAASDAGLATGAYHFFTFCSPGREQARHFLRVAPPRKGALVPAADVEFVGNCTSWKSLEGIRGELAIFLREVEQAWSAPPLLYVTADSQQRVLAGAFDRHATWLRSITEEPPETQERWLLWQFADASTVPGIRVPVDLNTLRPGRTLHALIRPARSD